MTTWAESKRRKNIKDHGFDFVGCDAIWDSFTITREDVRFSLGEAEKHEKRYYFEIAKSYFK